MKSKFSKIVDRTGKFCTYYQHSNFIAFSFLVGFDDDGKVNYISSVQYMDSIDGLYYVRDTDGNITEQEFNEAVFRMTEFMLKRNPSVFVRNNFNEKK